MDAQIDLVSLLSQDAGPKMVLNGPFPSDLSAINIVEENISLLYMCIYMCVCKMMYRREWGKNLMVQTKQQRLVKQTIFKFAINCIVMYMAKMWFVFITSELHNSLLQTKYIIFGGPQLLFIQVPDFYWLRFPCIRSSLLMSLDPIKIRHLIKNLLLVWALEKSYLLHSLPVTFCILRKSRKYVT